MEFKASVLGAYERGERAISVPRLMRLAEVYDVPADTLLPREAEVEIDLTEAEAAVKALRTEILETGSDLIVGDSVDVAVSLQAGRTSYDRAALLRYLTPAELADCSTVGADSVVLRIRAKVR